MTDQADADSPTHTAGSGDPPTARTASVPPSRGGEIDREAPTLSLRTDLPATALGPPQNLAQGLASLLPEKLLDDFEILHLLGEGGFAQVFLARQVSLDRLVALKISRSGGNEARTLASLEHDHIVHVFAEVVDTEQDLRLLCMQYVPGTTLESIIKALARRSRRTWSGGAILEAVDALSKGTTSFDPAALRDREFLKGCDFAEAVCWFGARVAEALAHAHTHGVLHRDVKPANILINRYGRPLLADFNVAFTAHRADPFDSGLGGTLAYMAPEHLDAFNPRGTVLPDAVDARADVYSLGIVLFELLTGRLPFELEKGAMEWTEYLFALAAQRSAGAPSPGRTTEVPEVLDRVVRRCLAPRPEDRYQTAAELARALDGCRELHHMEKELPPAGLIIHATLHHPFIMAVILILMPHVLGSVVNVSYNTLRIVQDLTPDQRATFRRLVAAYNAIAYPFALIMCYRLVVPVVRTLRRLAGPDPPDSLTVATVRRQALRLPLWAVGLSGLGWLPGGLLFPLGLDLLAGPISALVYGHFLLSFTISGLIALTYSVLAVEFVVLRLLYPRLWVDGQDVRTTARAELRPFRQVWVFQLLAVLIPLTAAVLMIAVGPESFDPTSYQRFRLLVTALLGMGMTGLGVTMLVSGVLNQTLAALAGGRRTAGPGSPRPFQVPGPSHLDAESGRRPLA